MLKYLIIITAFLLSFQSNGQDLNNSTRITVSEGNSTIQAFIQILDMKLFKPSDRKDYYFYYHNSIQHLQGSYLGNLLDGTYRRINGDQHMIQEGNFKCGLKTGAWKTWDKNGNLQSIESYKKGLRHGKSIELSNNGREVNVEKFKNGQYTKRGYKMTDGVKEKFGSNVIKGFFEKIRMKKKNKEATKDSNKKTD